MDKTSMRPPCNINIGDRFWVIAYSDRRVVQVECIGFYINVDPYNDINEGYLLVANVNNPRDYWKLDLDDFQNEYFGTKEEAERFLSL